MEGWRRGCWCRWIGGAFYSPGCPECCEHKSHVVLHAETLTDCHMVGHCQLNNHQHQSCLAIVNLSFLMATVGQMLTEKAGQLNTRSSPGFVPEPGREPTAVLLCLRGSVCRYWCELYPLGAATDCVQYKWCAIVCVHA